jgi:hypothetical protein
MLRSYMVWPARNTFCCWGYLMTGPPEDLLPNMCAWVTIVVPMTLFLCTWATTLYDASLPLLAFVLACFSSTIFWFLVTTFSDPGILPRNTDSPGARGPAPPLYRERIDDDGAIVTDTWCHTCRIYRPPRASHCSDCDNCVRDFDHHCPFTRNCIGARNYSCFIAFLVSVSVSLAVLLIVPMLSGVPVEEEPGDEQSGPVLRPPPDLGIGPILNTSLLVFAIVLSLPLWTFTGYHVALVCSGHTTKEHLKGRKHGARKLLCSRLLCCNTSPSEIHPRKFVPLPPGRTGCPPATGVPIITQAML